MEKRESSSHSLSDVDSSAQPDLPSNSPTAEASASPAATFSSAASSGAAALVSPSDHAASAPPTGAAEARAPAAAALHVTAADASPGTASSAHSSPAATSADVTDVPPAAVGAASAESSSPDVQSSALHHPRPSGLLPEAGFGLPHRPWSLSSSGTESAEAAAARLQLPPTLPPAPWLWDASLLDAFAASQYPAATAGVEARHGGPGRAVAGECPRCPPSAGLFLLPTSGGSVLRLEEAYVCESCCAVRAPEELAVEIEAYYCPNCFDSLTQAEALACGCCCTKCFDCPRCYACLSVMRQPREAVAAAAGRGLGVGPAVPPSSTGGSQPQRLQQGFDTAAAAAANEAEGVARRLLQEAGRSTSTSEEEEEEGGHLSAEDSALLAAAAPQRCESLLSLSSEEEEEDSAASEEEGPQAAHGKSGGTEGKPDRQGGSLSSSNERSSSGSEEKEEEWSGSVNQHQRAKKTQEGRRREHRYLYYFSCPYCRWDSQALQITSDSSALLPAAAIAEERVGGLLQRYFHQVLDVLQRAARDRERLRQLEARVKHKAVALLFAAAAAHDKRRVREQQQPREQRNEAAAAAGSEAATSENGGEQLLLSGGLSGGNKSWRVTDVEHVLTQRAAQNSFARSGDVWTAAYRSDMPQPPQYVGLQQLLRGEHALLQQQEESKVMTDVLFGWQLQQHEAEQLLKRSRAARDGTDSETRSKDSAAHEHPPEATGERRRSSIDTTIETPVAIPLHAPQLLLDRPSPDSPPLKLPAERLRGSLLFSRMYAAHNSNIGSNRGRSSGTTDHAKALEEWWTAEQATLEQRLSNPNSLIAAATSTSLLRPLRKKLLTRESKRCRACSRYLVKAHVSCIAVPPFRVNSAAALLLPWIVPRISTSGQLLQQGGVADVLLNLLNPTDRPLRLKFHFKHVVSHMCPADAALLARRTHENEGTTLANIAESKKRDTFPRGHSTVGDENDREETMSHAAEAADAATEYSAVSAATAGRDTTDSAAFVTAADWVEKSSEEEQAARQHQKEAAAPAKVLSPDWETMQIVTPDFELQLDRYDDMLGEFGDFDFTSSSRGSSRTDDFGSPSASPAAIEWKKGNSAQVRLQVQAKNGSQAQRQEQPAVCCLTLDVETTGLHSSTIRVQYLLFLGRVCATEKA